MTTKLLTRSCPKCSAEWVARKAEPPKKCPRCQAPYKE